jgi:uncharacterized lipoprotein YddW (UPF0748 family)
MRLAWLGAALLGLAGVLAPRAPADETKAGPTPQWRAFWVDAFHAGIKTPAQGERLVADVKAANGNAIIAQVRRRGDAYFRKTVDPFVEDPAVPEGFDPLGALLERAHAEGVQVHAWVNAMTLWRANDPAPRSRQHVFNTHGEGKTGRDSWLTCNEEGQTKFPVGYFLDAGHPDVSTHLSRVVCDLAKKYPVDGIHLDYIRYPESEGGRDQTGYGVGYNPVSVARFNKVHGRTGLPPRNDAAWKAWRRLQVTQLVRRLRADLLEANPRVMLSAALIPWGDGPADEAGWEKTAPYNRVFQNWHAWRQEGLLDLIVPMNYDREARPDQKVFFAHWVQFEKAYKYRSKTVVGLGAYLNGLAGTEAQLKLALSRTDAAPPADGVCFYNYASFYDAKEGGDKPTMDELRQLLTKGPFARVVPAPVVERVTAPTEGTLAGYATDAKGQPLDSQPVRVTLAEGGPVLELKTDGNGFFAAVFLRPGRYHVRLPGAANEQVVQVAAGRVTRVGKPPTAPPMISD